jgi:hypothetical protein
VGQEAEGVLRAIGTLHSDIWDFSCYIQGPVTFPVLSTKQLASEALVPFVSSSQVVGQEAEGVLRAIGTLHSDIWGFSCYIQGPVTFPVLSTTQLASEALVPFVSSSQVVHNTGNIPFIARRKNCYSSNARTSLSSNSGSQSSPKQHLRIK